MPQTTIRVNFPRDKWLKATGKEGYARARTRYPADGQGRVWWLV